VVVPRTRHTLGPTGPDQVPLKKRWQGVEANARLTGTVAALLLVLLAAEGVTVLRVRALLTAHVFIGMLLVPPVLLRMGSTGYRFVRYYAGSPPTGGKGPRRRCSGCWAHCSSY
jgi:hypothetical protein